jgi:hypothetical protein
MTMREVFLILWVLAALAAGFVASHALMLFSFLQKCFV